MNWGPLAIAGLTLCGVAGWLTAADRGDDIAGLETEVSGLEAEVAALGRRADDAETEAESEARSADRAETRFESCQQVEVAARDFLSWTADHLDWSVRSQSWVLDPSQSSAVGAALVDEGEASNARQSVVTDAMLEAFASCP